jgi:hypothetical protein
VARCSRFPARGGKSKRRHEATSPHASGRGCDTPQQWPVHRRIAEVVRPFSGIEKRALGSERVESPNEARGGWTVPSQGWNTPGAQAHGPQGAKRERRVEAGRSSSRERPRDRRTSRGPFVLRHGRELRSDWRWKVSRTAEAYVLHGTPAESVLAAFELSHRTRDRDSKSERAEEATGISAALTHERPPGGKRRGNLNRRRSAVRIAS